MKDKFNFIVGLDVDLEKAKSYARDDEKRYENMIIEGIASDSSKDMQGEIVEPIGFELDYFKKRGLLNLDHLTSRAPKEKSKYWIGEPIEAKVNDGKFYVKGKLWKKSPEARAFYDKCVEMAESGSSRKPGMSIEGQVLERDSKNPKKIKKVRITNVALTMNPVNGNTYLDLVKGVQQSDYVDYEFDTDKDFSTQNIMVEYQDEDENTIVVDKNFKVSLFRKPKDKKEEIILKNFRDGKISQKIYDDYIKKV